MLPPAVRFLFRVPCWPKIAPFHPSKRFSNKLPSRLFRFQRLQIPARKKLIATAFASGTGVAVSVVITSRTIHCESRDLKRAELLEATQARKEVERLKFRDLLSVLAPEWFRLLVAVIVSSYKALSKHSILKLFVRYEISAQLISKIACDGPAATRFGHNLISVYVHCTIMCTECGDV